MQLRMAALAAAAALLGGTATAAGAAAPPASAAQASFRLCDSRTFVALSVARVYLFEGRDGARAHALVKNNAWGGSMVDDLVRRASAGQVLHPAQFAGDVLAQCATAEGIPLGASKADAQRCLVGAEIAHTLHAERARGVARQAALAHATRALQPTELYPPALLAGVADAVYRPAGLPEVRRLSSEVLWSCIRALPRAAASSPR